MQTLRITFLENCFSNDVSGSRWNAEPKYIQIYFLSNLIFKMVAFDPVYDSALKLNERKKYIAFLSLIKGVTFLKLPTISYCSSSKYSIIMLNCARHIEVFRLAFSMIQTWNTKVRLGLDWIAIKECRQQSSSPNTISIRYVKNRNNC